MERYRPDGDRRCCASINSATGLINWDATTPRGQTHKLDFTKGPFDKGLFWDERVSRYTDPIPHGLLPTFKDEDEDIVKRKVKGWEMRQKCLEAFDALQKIGKALRAKNVARLTFTTCRAGNSKVFMDRIAKHCHAEVACFKLLTTVFDDAGLHYSPGKARLILDQDNGTDMKGTNVPRARVASPNLDDIAIAYVAKP